MRNLREKVVFDTWDALVGLAFSRASRHTLDRSQGGVKFPTGGDSPRAPLFRQGVSRSGEIPGPTVIVRMKENHVRTGVTSGVVGCALGPLEQTQRMVPCLTL
ncbi:hypothetical protein SAMN04488093_103270 [Tropicibacter naphthalenivorans]|uniref:Uncharacterized protein n=1 Tax=Tropicibacter naphthalenivorans TaxID=441103 RepID=A0A0P1GV37_9RHOB|nr:hypothetical protein TRN7648_02641 [Tropicibacter naphthalenivorans]SMC75105.1 hypothetical protein SAMN04488093_103270 [Tropicibacter naphthalenivorans]